LVLQVDTFGYCPEFEVRQPNTKASEAFLGRVDVRTQDAPVGAHTVGFRSTRAWDMNPAAARSPRAEERCSTRLNRQGSVDHEFIVVSGRPHRHGGDAALD